MKRVVRNEQAGVALVTTVIVIAVLAVVAVAFMQSTSTDRLSSRTVANYYKAQLAAKAGLAEAMALIQQGAQDFTYVSGAEPEGNSYRTFIRPVNEANGAWQFDGAPVYLDSGPGGNDGAQLFLTGSLDEPGLTRRAAWKDIPIDNARPNETNRYAFWVDDAAGKQNLTWWGGGGDRGVVTDLADLKLALPGQDGGEPAPFPPAALNALSGLRTYSDYGFSLDGTQFSSRKANVKLPSVASLNLVAPGVLGDSMEKYYFTIASASGATTPVGTPKLNLAALRQHINNLNSSQGPASPRAELVDKLLEEEPAGSEAWGGGSLSWLAKSGKYSTAEQKQIVANIIDYLDDDLIPTTDFDEARLVPIDPIFMGVEYKVNADGTVRGHPYINMVGFGSVYNWSGAGGTNTGALNSTLLLSFLGVVNPWSSSIELGDYEPRIEFAVAGNVQNGTLGEDAGNYFVSSFDIGPGSSEENPLPSGSLAANSGETLPGPASGLNYATRFDFLNGGGRQPPTIVFNNITYKPAKLRLLFKDTDGRQGYVQIVPPNLSVAMTPTTVATAGSGSSRVYKFTRLAEGQKDLHLAGDPRSNFAGAAWTTAESSGGDSAEIPTPNPEVDVTSNKGSEWDGAQNMSTGSDWYKSSGVTNHFNRLSREGMESIGELGYIWTGKPWQTLNLISTNNPASADWNLLDYVAAGRVSGGGITTVLPLKRASAEGAGPMTAQLLSSGGFNVNTRKLPTVAAVLSNSQGVALNAASAIAGETSGAQASAYGEIAALVDSTPSLLPPNTTTKFAKEAMQRALANVAVNHSRIFTVHAAGEYRLGDSVSRAQLEADVFVGVDPGTGDAMIQVIDQRFR